MQTAMAMALSAYPHLDICAICPVNMLGTGMFRIDHEQHNDLLRISVSGFWNLEDVRDYAKGLDATAHEAKVSSDTFNVLVDALAFPVQAEDVAALLIKVMQGVVARTSGLAAVVVGTQLAKLQAQRTLVHPRLKVFLSVAEAENWFSRESSSADNLSPD